MGTFLARPVWYLTCVLCLPGGGIYKYKKCRWNKMSGSYANGLPLQLQGIRGTPAVREQPTTGELAYDHI